MPALLFTDVVDSTLLTQRLGDLEAAQIWAAHDSRARALLRQHQGREIDRADGFFLLFARATDALCYAQAYHSALAGLGLRARVGLHVGAVTLRETGADDVAMGAKRVEVDGLAKPFAARIMGLAAGGQTLLSAAARQALAEDPGEALGSALPVHCHGHYRLKGIDEPVEVFEAGPSEGPFVPPPDTDKACRVVHHGGHWRPVREVPNNLAAERDAFIGRQAELRLLAGHLDAGCRLLTVTGAGGAGKTRLVRRHALARLGDWPGGVYFCDLSEARSIDGIHRVVAEALDVALGKDDPALQLGHAIAGRGRCLVILDNFEQVVQHAPTTLGRWLDRAALAAFLVTSRERLHLAGEQILAVEPLPLAREAIELFEVRARTASPDFALGEHNLAAVTEVVRLLDGLPLAIELVAARVPVLSPTQLVERMRDRFKLLGAVGAGGGAAARQATLRTAIDWSWQLLAAWEQAALAQCAVFEGGFTLEAAEAVLDLSGWPDAPPVMDLVQALVGKSLLRRWVPAGHNNRGVDEPRFGMYLSIHEFASAKLAAADPPAPLAAAQRHGRHYAEHGKEEALEALFLRGGEQRHRALGIELDNIVAACRRAAGRGDVGTASSSYRALWAALDLRGPFALGLALGAEVCALDGIAEVPGHAAWFTRALVSIRVGRVEEAQRWLEATLAGSSALGDQALEGKVHGHLAVLYRDQGRIEDASRHFEAAVAIHREVGSRRLEGWTLGHLAILQIMQGRVDEARRLFEDALAILREVGSRRDEGAVINNLAIVHQQQGRTVEARIHVEEALAIQRETGNRRLECGTLGCIGEMLFEQGDYAMARSHGEAALAMAREIGERWYEGPFLENLGKVALAQGRLDEAQSLFEQALVTDQGVGDRRSSGTALGGLAELAFQRGDPAAAAAALRQGEALLREAGAGLELAQLLCLRGHVDLADQRPRDAEAALAEASAAAAAMGAGPDSALARKIAKLRASLG